MIVNYDYTVITIVNYDRKTCIVHSTDLKFTEKGQIEPVSFRLSVTFASMDNHINMDKHTSLLQNLYITNP
jgi:hypothetical protein